jgi:transcriptional regulator with XRE-family HTH domain
VEPFLQSSVKPWLFQVEPYPDESFGHFLGRFRRANCLSRAHLSAMLGQRSYIVSYWESPSRQRRPGTAHLEQLSRLTGVDIPRFHRMWFPPGIQLHWPTRLCPDCYAEAPWHKLTWQLADRPDCGVHQRSLLAECPCCHHAFQLPSYWATAMCDRCRLPFAHMGLYRVATDNV